MSLSLFFFLVSKVLPLQFFQQNKALRGYLKTIKKVNGESLIDSRKHSNLLYTSIAKGFAPLVPNVEDGDPVWDHWMSGPYGKSLKDDKKIKIQDAQDKDDIVEAYLLWLQPLRIKAVLKQRGKHHHQLRFVEDCILQVSKKMKKRLRDKR